MALMSKVAAERNWVKGLYKARFQSSNTFVDHRMGRQEVGMDHRSGEDRNAPLIGFLMYTFRFG